MENARPVWALFLPVGVTHLDFSYSLEQATTDKSYLDRTHSNSIDVNACFIVFIAMSADALIAIAFLLSHVFVNVDAQIGAMEPYV